MNFSSLNPRKWALLTGAGFSANWGVPVAQEIWADIISDKRVHDNYALRDALLSKTGFNYESVLGKAQRGEFGAEGRQVLEMVIERIFNRIQTRLVNDELEIDYRAIRAFVRYFSAGSSNETGFLFTLNQDMILETECGFGHCEGGVIRPGVLKDLKLGEIFRINLPAPQGVRAAAPNVRVLVDSLINEPCDPLKLEIGDTYYLKLHGSWDWATSDGSFPMVMGEQKEVSISKRPLLSFYYSIFKEFINYPDRRLLIIGYGFQDEHINMLLSEAISQSGLKIHIWDALSPNAMRGVIWPDHPEIWKGICGFTQRSFRHLIRVDDLGVFASEGENFLKSLTSES